MHPGSTARDLWTLLEPIHDVTYFSPEPLAALRSAGYRGFWMGYFAGRAAPLGAAGPELVHAVFHNFTLEHVARALPDAWHLAPPQAALTARLDGSVAALRRHLGDRLDAAQLSRAADLAGRAASTAPMEGRALFAANRALPVPTEPLARLWHSATLLREHRGDGHVAVLTAAGISGREAHRLHAAAAGLPAELYGPARYLDGEEWTALTTRLRDRGLFDEQGDLTGAGRALKQQLEDQTDELAATAYQCLTEDEIAELLRLLRPMAAAVVASGELPSPNPVGLDLDAILGHAPDPPRR